jgi:hypothetical protein
MVKIIFNLVFKQKVSEECLTFRQNRKQKSFLTGKKVSISKRLKRL